MSTGSADTQQFPLEIITFLYELSKGVEELVLVTMFHGIPASGGMGGGKSKDILHQLRLRHLVAIFQPQDIWHFGIKWLAFVDGVIVVFCSKAFKENTWGKIEHIRKSDVSHRTPSHSCTHDLETAGHVYTHHIEDFTHLMYTTMVACHSFCYVYPIFSFSFHILLQPAPANKPELYEVRVTL